MNIQELEVGSYYQLQVGENNTTLFVELVKQPNIFKVYTGFGYNKNQTTVYNDYRVIKHYSSLTDFLNDELEFRDRNGKGLDY